MAERRSEDASARGASAVDTLDASPGIGSWEWDRHSGAVRWSVALQRVHGLEPGTFGGTFDDFTADIHPDDREQVLAAIAEALETPDRPYRNSYRIVTPDGLVRWVEAYGEQVLAENGSVAGMRGVCIDVSAEHHRARQRDAVYAVNHALAAATDLDEGLRTLTRIVGEAFDCSYVEYRDSEDGGRTLHARAGWAPAGAGADLDAFARQIELATDRGPAARAWSSGNPTWIDDLESAPPSPRRTAALMADLRGAFAIPVTDAGRVIGVLCAFTRVLLQDAGLPPTLDALAAEVSQFVRRLRAENELRTNERQQAAVAELGRLALQAPFPGELFDHAGHLVSETLDAEYVKVLQLLPDQEGLRLVSGVGWQDGLVGQATVSSDAASQAGYTLRVDHAVIVRDLREDTRFQGPPLLHAHGIVSGISTVIRGEGGAWGVLGAYTQRPRAYSEDDALFLESIANTLAGAIDRASRERAQQFLLRANDVLFESLDYRETLAALAALAVTEVADWCIVYLLDERGERHPLEIAHRDPARVQLVERYRQRLGREDVQRVSVVDVAMATGETQLVPRITLDDLRNSGLSSEAIELLEELRIGALAVAPLRTRERTLGAILLVSAESGYRYGPTEQRMVEELARRAAIAIDNAHLYEQMRDAVQTREDFVAVASHELRSPLTSILGYTARLERLGEQGRLDADAQESLAIVHGEARRMQQTIELFLDMAGLDTGRLTMEPEPADLAELLDEATGTLRRQHEDLQLEVRLPEDAVPVETDTSRLGTILSNLLSNAVKYGGDPPRVTVALERVPGGARIRVRDNGPGIPEADRERIFDRFYRSASAEHAGRRGLGLGLYISRQIAERLGASLTFETWDGEGTEFTIEIPERAPHTA